MLILSQGYAYGDGDPNSLPIIGNGLSSTPKLYVHTNGDVYRFNGTLPSGQRWEKITFDSIEVEDIDLATPGSPILSDITTLVDAEKIRTSILVYPGAGSAEEPDYAWLVDSAGNITNVGPSAAGTILLNLTDGSNPFSVSGGDTVLVKSSDGSAVLDTSTTGEVDITVPAALREVITIQEYEKGESVGAAAAGGTNMVVIPAALNGYNLTAATAAVHTLGDTTGSETVDVSVIRRRAGSDVNMFSAPITLNESEYFQSDGIINVSNDDVQTGDVLLVAIVMGLLGTAPQGLVVALTFEKA